MIKSTFVTLCMTGLLMMSGCSSNSLDSNTKGPSSGDGKTVGSLSGGESAIPSIEGEEWSTIEIDLMHYLRGTKDRIKPYTIKMTFEGKEVLAEADCYTITARYKLRDDELSFSKVSSPKSVDRASCRGYRDADEAVLAFFTSDYTILKSSNPKAVVLEATDLDTSVTLKR